MNGTRAILVLTALGLAAMSARAAEPVVIDMRDSCKVRRAIVTIGNVAGVAGGDPALREKIARIDLADLKPRETGLTVTRRVVEYRLQLAGIDPAAVRFSGAERTAVAPDRRTVSADEVAAAAKAEALRWLTVPKESVAVELLRPIAVRLPEVPADELVIVTVTPKVKPVGMGRVQMQVVIATAEETLLGLGVDLEVKPLNRPMETVMQAGGVVYPSAQSQPQVMQAGGVVYPPAQSQPQVIQAGGVVYPPAQSQPPVIQAGGVVYPPAQTQPQAAMPPAYATPPAAAPNANAVPANAVLVQSRQRVMMLVHSGGLNVSAVGEAQQEGRMGQSILVQNIDSKKVVQGRVTGPGTVEIDLEPRKP